MDNVTKTASDVADKAVEKLAAGSAQMYGDLKSIVEYAKEHAPEAWQILVRQQRIEGWTNICSFVVATLLFSGVAFLCYKFWRGSIAKDRQDRLGYESDRTGVCLGAFIMSSVVLVGVVIASIIIISCNIPKVLNPEYYAGIQACKMVTGKNCEGNSQ